MTIGRKIVPFCISVQCANKGHFHECMLWSVQCGTHVYRVYYICWVYSAVQSTELSDVYFAWLHCQYIEHFHQVYKVYGKVFSTGVSAIQR